MCDAHHFSFMTMHVTFSWRALALDIGTASSSTAHAINNTPGAISHSKVRCLLNLSNSHHTLKGAFS